jgi:competence protein ComEC
MYRLVIFAGILTGLLFSYRLGLTLLIWLALSMFFALGAVVHSLHIKKTETVPGFSLNQALLLFLAFFCMAGVRIAFGELPTPKNHLNAWQEKSVSFNAVIDRPPVIGAERTQLSLTLKGGNQKEAQPDQGRTLIIFTDRVEGYRYGDLLSVSGNLTRLSAENPNSYGAYLDRSGYDALIYNPTVAVLATDQGNPLLSAVYWIRGQLLEKVYQIYPAPENSLMAGILLGDESQIPKQMEEDFRRTGTAHIIAISGMNFSLLLWMLAALLNFFPNRWWRPLTLIPFIVIYTLMTGARPAIMRAAVMAGMALFARSIGRRQAGVDGLMLTVIVMGFFNPKLFFDVGFQLSVFATLGILLFNEPISAFLDQQLKRVLSESRADTLLKVLREILITSLSAQLLTTWIIAAAFNQFSPLSLIVNMAVAPFQTLLMAGGIISLLGAVIFPPLGQLLGVLTNFFPALTIRIIALFARIPWASMRVVLPWGSAWILITIILGAWWMRVSLKKPKRSFVLNFGLIVLTLVTVMVWKIALESRDTSLTIKISASKDSSTIEIRTPTLKRIVLAQGINGHTAQQLLRDTWGDPKKTVLAVLELEKGWMADSLKSASYDDNLVLFCNDQQLSPSTAEFSLDGLQAQLVGFHLSLAASHLRRNAWLIEYDALSVLIPNGIQPSRFESPLNLKAIDFLLLTETESKENWLSYLSAQKTSGNPIEILTISSASTLTMQSDGSQDYFFRD